MSATTQARNGFLRHFEELGQRLAGQGPEWLRRARNEARDRFMELGLPSPGDEEWRNTPLAALTGSEYEPAAPEADPASLTAAVELDSPRLRFVNGRLDEAGSSRAGLPEGVRLHGLAEALEQDPDHVRSLLERSADEAPDGAFEALNGAFCEDGALISVAAGTRFDTPLELRFVSGGAQDQAKVSATHPMTLIDVGEGAQLRVVEQYVGAREGAYLTNGRTRVRIGRNGSLEHYRLQLQGTRAYHVDSLRTRQERDSRYVTYGIDLGGRLARHELRSILDGEGADCRLFGLYVTEGAQHVDNHTVLDHARPHGDSRELYKGILDGKSSSVFSGRIVVRRDAQQTDAKQSNPNLLLSPTALAHTRPQLEIYADDVKCTHGATVGQLDADAIFYLQSRGVPARQARNLLVHAFAGEVLERIEPEALRDDLERRIAERLGGSGGKS